MERTKAEKAQYIEGFKVGRRWGYSKGKAWGAKRAKNYKKCCLVRMSGLGMNVRDMALVLHIDPGTIYKWRKERGVRGNNDEAAAADRKQRIYMPVGKGRNKGIEMTYTGVAYHPLAQLKAFERKPKRQRVPGGFEMAINPSERVGRVLQLRHNGMMAGDIARELSISPQSVYKALRRWQGRWTPQGTRT